MGRGHTGFSVEELRAAFDESESGRVSNQIGAVMIESPVRHMSGQIVPYDEMEAITNLCREKGVGIHLDGARLYMMSSATGISPKEYSALFDTVYVSLYKYFGAPYGAILAGSHEVIDGLYHDRRMFGGGLSSTYMAAAIACQGLKGFEERFSAAMSKARALFKLFDSLDGLTVRSFEHGSNIFPLHLDPSIDVQNFLSKLKERWVFLYPMEGTDADLQLTVNTTILRQLNDDILEAFRRALS